jgi:transcriptional regulator with XRE-family HTH domain
VITKNRDPWLRIVGENVRRERKKAKLTQEKLAERAELSPRVLQKIEAGQITILITTVRRLKKSLGCGWDELLGS